MSILAYTGLPGAGKSYAVVEHQILPALRAGRRVVTNIPMHVDAVRSKIPTGELVELPLEKITATPEAIYEYVTPGSVLVLDEVWRIFPAGQRADKVPEPFRKLLAEHRHMVNEKGESAQLVLVTQDLAQVAAFARQLVEQTFRTVKLSSVGIRGGYRLDVFNGPITGPNPPLQNRLREVYGRYSKDVWQFYKSHTMSEATSSGADERAVDRRGNLLRSPALLATAAVVVLGVLFVIPRAFGLLQKDGMAELAGHKEQPTDLPAAAEPQAGTRPLVPMPVAAPSAASPAQPVAQWVIVGYVDSLDNAAHSRVIISDGRQHLILPSLGFCAFDDYGIKNCRFRGQVIYEGKPASQANSPTSLPPVAQVTPPAASLPDGISDS